MSAKVSLRVATAGDEPAVSALLGASYTALMRGAYRDGELEAALPELTRANPALLTSGRFYLAYTLPECVVAVGGWSHERPGTGEIVAGLAHLRHFGTHPDWTGRGIGRRIYRRCEREARHDGVTALEAYASLNARGFYAALAFEPVERVQIRLRGGQELPALLMRRNV